MTQEDKELLLKDLCTRLPHGVKAQYYGIDEEDTMYDTIDSIYVIGNGTVEVGIGQYGLNIEDIKPYLFPLSSMTEEQENEWYQLHVQPLFDRLGVSNRKEDLILQAKSLYIGTDWLNAHHFDYRGLIPMGLANDATGLNIY